MGNVFVSLDEEHEELLRRMAQEEYSGKKGSLSEIIQKALDTLTEKKQEQEQKKKAKGEMLLRMKQAKKLGVLQKGKAYIKRDELYER